MGEKEEGNFFITKRAELVLVLVKPTIEDKLSIRAREVPPSYILESLDKSS
jgi:hypothetical protein